MHSKLSTIPLFLVSLASVPAALAGRGKNKCFGKNEVLLLNSIAIGDYIEGSGTKMGERIIWFDDEVIDEEGDTIGRSSGICTVVAEAESSRDGLGHSKCDLEFDFDDGPLAGSKLLFSGLYDTAGVGSYTITGGSGCFAGVSGRVNEVLTTSESPWIYQDMVILEDD